MNYNYKFHIINQAKTNYNLSYNDYYPYGMLVPKCNYSNPVYRYGFQGQEKDNEIKGIGNSVNYKFRMYSPRVGRFFAVDPLTKKYPWYTPYQFSGNQVTISRELEGLESDVDMNAQVTATFTLGEKSGTSHFNANFSIGKGSVLHYAGQSSADQSLNMAQSFLRLNTANRIFQISHSGSFDMFSQNVIHDAQNFHRFLSTTPNQLNFTVGITKN